MTVEASVRSAVADHLEAAPRELGGAGARLAGWCRGLAGPSEPHAYFVHPLAFPTVALPAWAEESLGAPEPGLLAELTSSTVAGYWFVRLVDDVMDDGCPVARGLLPLTAWLHHRFERPYARRFAADHPFWDEHRAGWAETAMASCEDAQPGSIDLARFEAVSARKVAAARVPLAAVFAARDQPMPPVWTTLVRELAAFHQLHNDVHDWARDHAAARATWFLSEGERRGAARDRVAAWVVDEGMGLAHAELERRLHVARALAGGLGSWGLDAWLDAREARHRAEVEDAAAGLAVLRVLRRATA